MMSTSVDGGGTVVTTVPFTVETLSDNVAKATFQVPAHLAAQLVEQPILCCGSCFELHLVEGTSTTVTTTCYTSMDPESTAMEISKRLAKRMQNPTVSGASLSSMVFGGTTRR
jgi:hypothetical protein